MVDQRAPFDPGNVAKAHEVAGGVGEWQILEFTRRATLVETAQVPGKLAGSHRSSGCVHRQRHELLRQFVEGQAEFEQGAGVYLDGDLLTGEAVELDHIDAPCQEVVLHLPGQGDQLGRGALAGDEHCSDKVQLAQGEHHRLLDVGGKAPDLRDPLLDAVHGLLHIGVRFHFHLHERRRIPGDAPHRLHIGHGLELLFQRCRHQLLDILGAGTPPKDVGVDPRHRLHRIETDGDLRDRPGAREDHEQHAKVRCQAMLDKNLD